MRSLKAFILTILLLQATGGFTQNLTKEETINYINKKIIEAKNKLHPFIIDEEGHFNKGTLTYSNSPSTIFDNTIRMGSGGRVQYAGYFATDQYGCGNNQHYAFTYPEYYSGLQSTVEFLPAHISAVEIIQTAYDVGLLKLSFIPNAIKQVSYYYKKRAECSYPGNGDAYCNCWSYDSKYSGGMYTTTYFDYDNTVYIPFVKIQGDDSKLKKAFEYLKDLYKAEEEDDPFGK